MCIIIQQKQIDGKKGCDDMFPSASRVESKGLVNKDLLTIDGVSRDEILFLIQDAIRMKKRKQYGQELKGKTLGMIFEKSSTRTRVSFEAAMIQLGGHAMFLSSRDLQLGRGESIEDTAKVLSRYVDGVMIRTYEHEKIETFANHASIPVINGLTDTHHPTQALADLMTIYEYKKTFSGLKLAYVGDGNNMAHSLMEACVKVGIHISLACPEGYMPDEDITAQVQNQANVNGVHVFVTSDPKEAVQDADIIVTDVWASMGDENEAEERVEIFKPYQVNQELCKNAKSDYLFMHCLPAHRGEEVTADIIDGSHSVVFDEAENRLHIHKAILKGLL